MAVNVQSPSGDIISDVFLGKDFVRLSERDAPALHRTVAKLARNAGIGDVGVYTPNPESFANSTRINRWRKNCAALMVGPQRIVVGDRFLELMTGNSRGQLMTAEMEAVLAHELAHLKNDRGLASLGKTAGVATLAGLASAFAGVLAVNYAYEHFLSHKNDDKQQDAATHAAHVVLMPHKAQEITLGEKILSNAFVLAGAGVALRKMNYAKEFRADRVSAELLKDGKPQANALKKLMAEGHKMEKAIEAEMKQTGSKETATAFQHLKGAASDIVNAINNMIGTHPDLSKRIERLEAMRF